MSPTLEPTSKNGGAASMPDLDERAWRFRERDHAVEEAIRRRIDENVPYAHYFSKVTCECVAGTVKVRGFVPTHRLKQVLWLLLRNFDEVTQIDDHLMVVSSTGLSSILPR
jgi:hypothetical protein